MNDDELHLLIERGDIGTANKHGPSTLKLAQACERAGMYELLQQYV